MLYADVFFLSAEAAVPRSFLSALRAHRIAHEFHVSTETLRDISLQLYAGLLNKQVAVVLPFSESLDLSLLDFYISCRNLDPDGIKHLHLYQIHLSGMIPFSLRRGDIYRGWSDATRRLIPIFSKPRF
jgi:hypothetical protein